jgi:hypothetical protein
LQKIFFAYFQKPTLNTPISAPKHGIQFLNAGAVAVANGFAKWERFPPRVTLSGLRQMRGLSP